MKLRLLPAVLAAGVLASVLLVAEPALAAPAAPGIGPLNTDTAGKVSGTVSSSQPFVFVGLDSGDGAAVVPTRITMLLSKTFHLDTWGFRPGTTLLATACPTGTYDADACSPAATQTFDPQDLVPSVTWFTDDHVGPGDPQPVITVSDPGGGGLLVAMQETGSGTVRATHVVPPGTPEAIPVYDLLDGVLRLYRCSSDQTQCAAFAPDQSRPLSVLQHLVVRNPAPISPVNASTASSFQLQFLTSSADVPVSGTATVSWHLVHVDGGATEGPDHVDPAAPTDSTGHTAPSAIAADGVPDGDYSVVGVADLETADFGTFHDVPFDAGQVLIDVNPPTFAIRGSHPTIYPNINLGSRPGSLVWIISGTDISRGEIQSSNGTTVRQVWFHSGSSAWSTQWDGHGANSKVVPAGTYKLVLWDRAGNPVPSQGVVKVDTRHLVTKTWKRTISAAGSLVDGYAGRCATLRKPSLRGWYNSLGYYSNTRCESQSSKDSLASTLHGIYLPKVSDGYVTVGVDFYGGSARSRPGSEGVLRYLSAAGYWTQGQFQNSSLGYHSGWRRAPKGMIGKDRSFYWGFYAAYGHRYDIKSFTVVVVYKTLG